MSNSLSKSISILQFLKTLHKRLHAPYRNFRPIIRGLSDFRRQKMIVAGNLPVRII